MKEIARADLLGHDVRDPFLSLGELELFKELVRILNRDVR
jgi:hypothetical protein